MQLYNVRGFATHRSPAGQKTVARKSPSTINAGEARFRTADLSPAELQRVFGRRCPPPHIANRLLRILQYRRLHGTLDLELPSILGSTLENHPSFVENGLRWLRKTYPVDEDAAILARIVKEEEEAEKAALDRSDSQLIARAQQLGLYKPQSGNYGAKLGPNNSVYGEGVLDRIKAERERRKAVREENLKREEKEKLDRAIAEGRMRPMELSTEADGREIRRARFEGAVQHYQDRVNQWTRKYAAGATSKLTLDSPEIAGLGFVKRFLPTFLFASGLTVVCYYYAQNFGNPPQSKRLFTSYSVSETTIGVIIAMNIGVFLLWKGFPPAINILNKYFLHNIATPTAFSALGSSFSHSRLRHLTINMLVLYLLGLSLHEQIGRPTFLAVYLTAGTLSSLVCLAAFAARGMLRVSSLGASGATSGVFACSAMLNPNASFSPFFVPEKWKETISISGNTALKFLIGFELFGATTKYLGLTRSHVNTTAHLAGYAIGAAWALALEYGWVWKRRRRETGEEVWLKFSTK